ncbi:DoxX family protein [Paenibacillus sp. WST5]|uniref:DoxX family protein n=1 Tax=Paenibacillus sedimenti TaxID=2770274 RepID=A0A926KS86_9BACL|nr:DoxX family protein [Paenibacillus sedimenti]
MSLTLVILKWIVICMFAFSSAIKFLRTKSMVRHWNEYRYPMWFMHVTAILELIGSFGILISSWVPATLIYAAALLAVLMLGAIHAHLARAKHSPFMAINACLMLILSITLIVA